MIRSMLLAVFILLTPWFLCAQTVTSFEGISAAHDPHPEYDVDPNGAIGTKQYMEWANVAYQAWSKTPPFKKLFANPVLGTTPFTQANLTSCESIGGDGLVSFDRLASRWIIAAHSNKDASGNFYFCIAISNTDDLSSNTLQWYAYEFLLNTAMKGNYFPDWPKIGTWPDAYYVGMDLLAPPKYNYAGIMTCALDRTNMLTGGSPRPMQCVTYTAADAYLYHSPVPADVDGTTAPPSGQDEFFVSIQNPVRDGKSTTSNALNLWDFKLDTGWNGNSKLVQSSLTVPTFTPGCYDLKMPGKTTCVPQPAGLDQLNSVGDRLMPRMAYRNFSTYQSWLVSQTVQLTSSSKQTGINWYELRGTGTGTPTLYQSGTVSLDNSTYRFMPSIAQDHVGNAAVGYSVGSSKVKPGIRASSWSLTNNTNPVEVNIQNGNGSQENSRDWGDYSSMTVDPVDDCTFWYVNEYLPSNETGKAINWHTRIANFKVSSCQ
jgi:hypothetical protein